ncbi:MAG: gliding motility protein GldB [Bacteroidaceae bacterium]|nr:gliding motility protein GldB [Bacteroidaceae bacterium]
MKHRLTLFILLLMLCAIGIGSWFLTPWESWGKGGDAKGKEVVIDRYDRVLDEYVSLNSYTALGRMNTQYPMETKLLIEDVLKLGVVNEPDVEQRLRYYYLDSTVQVLLDEVHRQYADMSDIEADFNRAFEELRKQDPDFRTPHVYTQISCLNQSIVVGDTLIGISLDKYLGADFPLYAEYYSPEQRTQMTRDAIVRDAINAYLARENRK